MAIKSISTLMADLKESYDKSKDRSSWKVLQGAKRECYDTFIAGDKKLWQIKSEEVGMGEMVAVGTRLSRPDDDIEKIMRTGSPVPFGIMTPQNRKLSIMMAGVQTFSSDSSNMLCKDYLSGNQAALEHKLKCQVHKMMDDPVFRKKYTEHKDRLRRPYL
ncbi:MAG: hypothetical protein O8C66_07330 [Candidatus Methanoperedens sp.]|nr:hypothetical protein [Candidatus Methanoperedens sp.]MCZ7370306.1 hypothetical protein [Candidatus Methanoperedens sp.]